VGRPCRSAIWGRSVVRRTVPRPGPGSADRRGAADGRLRRPCSALAGAGQAAPPTVRPTRSPQVAAERLLGASAISSFSGLRG
jgi:hypothetical protein